MSQRTPMQLQPSQQLIISRMWANPKPDDFTGIAYPCPSDKPAPHRECGKMKPVFYPLSCLQSGYLSS